MITMSHTLASVLAQFGFTTRTHPASGTTIVEAAIGAEGRSMLFNLTDHTLFAASGELVWLKSNKGFVGGVPYGN
jgi:hypothetical protein